MRRVCVWCEAAGRRADLGEREPYGDASETAGICAEHQTRLLEALQARRAREAGAAPVRDTEGAVADRE